MPSNTLTVRKQKIRELWYLYDQKSYLNSQLTTDALGVEAEKYVNLGSNQTYPYTDQLLALEACRPTVPRPMPILETHITSPLLVDNWRQALRALRNHPDRCFVQYLLEDLAQGFRIGFNPE